VDLALYLRVIWRFRLLVLVGLLLGFILALLSYTRVEFQGGAPGLEYRDPHIYESRALLLVTQSGFPLGRAVFDEVVPIEPSAGSGAYVPKYSEPIKFTQVAILFAHVFMSDDVQALIKEETPAGASVRANPVFATGETVLPEIEIESLAETPGAAHTSSVRAVEVFRRYLAREQAANKIEPDKRIVLSVLTRASDPVLVAGPPITRPLVVFLAVMSAVLALAFILENLRPRVRSVARRDEAISEPPDSVARRSA
jgi:hypothetical protein